MSGIVKELLQLMSHIHSERSEIQNFYLDSSEAPAVLQGLGFFIWNGYDFWPFTDKIQNDQCKTFTNPAFRKNDLPILSHLYLELLNFSMTPGRGFFDGRTVYHYVVLLVRPAPHFFL